ncbi:hypothetical protein P691DRAFT_791276 [Macrolepiota fuliginosa MF-IS2]|uniref:Uncharacterized protein n=1 Tax=Macrolepiota fuliginosa MF-IS2 TaxID=1400762 RepID=A0A9P6C2T9_9AGAR|nr:hypothetical protein P691DRAFT_791276 [Macrolepiota fuliginosa MF-IS2]
MPPRGGLTAPKLQNFKTLPEAELAKLSLEELDAYYDTVFEQLEKVKAGVGRKHGDEEHKQQTECKEEGLAGEKIQRRVTRSRTRMDDKQQRCGPQRPPERQTKRFNKKEEKAVVAASPGVSDPSSGQIFSHVEVEVASRQREDLLSHVASGVHKHLFAIANPPSSYLRLPEWWNDGEPLPYIPETDHGVAWPATVHLPKVLYQQDSITPYTKEELTIDKEKAKKCKGNDIHSYTVAEDGCVYHKAASWRPTRHRCTCCIKDGLHCWRRVIRLSERCLRCTYKRHKCETDPETVLKENTPSVHELVADTSKRQRTPDDVGHRLSKRQKPATTILPLAANPDTTTLKFLGDLCKELARHHATLTALIDNALGVLTEESENSDRSSDDL